MQVVRTVGLDIAKSVFQVHGVDGAGQVVIRRQLKRRYVLRDLNPRPTERLKDAQHRPKPAIRLSRKDWLLRADRAVLCPVPGAGCASGSCPAGFFC
jgi:hypothetical protein